MKENKIVIEINCPSSKIFDFTLNPANTPLWIDRIVHEEASEFPARIGTRYKNVDKQGKWDEYTIVRLELNRMFEMKQKNSPYHVRYTFEPISENKSRFTYFEWVDEGELEGHVTLPTIKKLKEAVENQ